MTPVDLPRFKFFLCVAFFIFICAAVFSPSILYNHDWQRVVFVGLGVFSVIFFYFTRGAGRFCSSSLCRLNITIFAMLFFVGLISSLNSHQPVWAFSEIAVWCVFLLLVFLFFFFRWLIGEGADYIFLIFIFFLCALKVAQFLSSTLSAFLGDINPLDTDLLLDGFSNKRFYGQFQTFTLPLLTFPLLLLSTQRSAKYWIFTLLGLWWLIAISGGTRGTWLGLGVASMILYLTGYAGRYWIRWQLAAVLIAGLLYWLIFSVLTDYCGIQIRSMASDRLTTSLSGRGPLWQQAWDMIRERPWLGFGPMHFADIHNPIAAHPHQAILQWASEWGVPSTLLVMWLVGRGLWATFRLIRERADSSDPVDLLRVCLFASLIGALTQSMVDGVIVMPYSQLWLSLVVGWLMGIHAWKGEPAKPNAFIHWSWMGISTAAVLFLVYVVIRDVPHLDERNRLYQEQYGGHFQPRFWTQGVIAIKPR
ncbi:O-antigen ligase family protein [Pseudomonas gingeri]